MKRWAILTVLLYMLLVVAMIWPVTIAAFADFRGGIIDSPVTSDDMLKLLRDDFLISVPGWASISCAVGWLGLAQAAMLVVPMRIASGRPVGRRHVCFPLIAGLMAFLPLMVGSAFSVIIYILQVPEWNWSNWVSGMAIFAGLWLAWAFLFAFQVGKSEPPQAVRAAARSLIAAGAIGLIIAVCCLVVVRDRDNYVIIKAMPTIGALSALSVILLALGPVAFRMLVRHPATEPVCPQKPREVEVPPAAPMRLGVAFLSPILFAIALGSLEYMLASFYPEAPDWSPQAIAVAVIVGTAVFGVLASTQTLLMARGDGRCRGVLAAGSLLVGGVLGLCPGVFVFSVSSRELRIPGVFDVLGPAMLALLGIWVAWAYSLGLRMGRAAMADSARLARRGLLEISVLSLAILTGVWVFVRDWRRDWIGRYDSWKELTQGQLLLGVMIVLAVMLMVVGLSILGVMQRQDAKRWAAGAGRNDKETAPNGKP